MNKAIKTVLLLGMIGGLIFGLFKLIEKKEEKQQAEVIEAEKKAGEAGNTKEASLPVTLLRIKKGDLPLRLPISANADVWEKATLKAEVGGTVQNIKYDIGSRVNKNDLLVKLDDSEIQLQVQRAQAQKLQSFSKYLVNESIYLSEDVEMKPEEKKKLEELKKNYFEALEKYQAGKLDEKKYQQISDEYQEYLISSGLLRDDIRKANDGLAAAEVQEREARLNLKRTFIRSPFPGTIADLKISKGERITVGQELLKVVNLQTLYLRGFALESEVKHLKKGISVRIKFDAFPERYFQGKISFISPEIDPENKTITVFVAVDNKDNMILPGMHAEIDVEYQVFKDVVKVPRTAVIVRQERPLIFKVKDKMAIWQYVELGDKNDEEQIIKSGVEEGDRIVVDGHLTLAHQSKVKVLETHEQK